MQVIVPQFLYHLRSMRWWPVFLLLLLMYLPAGQALESDRRQPINVQADKVKLNEKTGRSEYYGNVQMSQGSIQLRGDKVVVHHVDGKLKKIVISGSPAYFQQKPGKDQPVVKARADYMEYLTLDERLILEGNAEVTQGPNLFSGQYIDFDTRNSTVTARGGDSKNGEDRRVRAIIHPASKPDTTNE